MLLLVPVIYVVSVCVFSRYDSPVLLQHGGVQLDAAGGDPPVSANCHSVHVQPENQAVLRCRLG